MRLAAGAMILAAMVAVVGGAPAALVAPARAEPARAAYEPDAIECAVLEAVNRFRARHGKPALGLSVTLGAAADFHSEDMAEKNYFSHDLKGGTSWSENIRDHGYSGNPVGENIAAGQKSAREVTRAWKTSPEHRSNMLDGEFRAIGIGRAYEKDSKYGWYWTTTFGGRVDREASCR